jgi:DNA-binding transcriptional LysR family regulator
MYVSDNSIVQMSVIRTTPDQWRVLAAVIDRGGFAQAAASLHRSQSAVSYAVAQLQKSLGIALLKIEGRKAQLTPHGATLLKRSRALLGQFERLEDIARSLTKGWESEIRLVVDAAFPRQRLLEILAELKRSCSSTTLSLADAVLSGAEDAIVAGEADVIVTTLVPSGYLGDWLFDVSMIAVCAPGHPLAAGERALTLDDLVQHTQCVVRDSGRDRPRDEGWLGAQHRWTVGSVEASLATVRAGLTYAWLPEHLVQPLLRAAQLKPLRLRSGARRKLSMHAVLARPEAAGPAARLAYDLFRGASSAPNRSGRPSRRSRTG